MSDEIVLEVNGLKLCGKWYGPENGIPTLALHGWLDNAESFYRLAPQLNELRICALDLPGHGKSDHRPQGAFYDNVYYAADVLAFVKALGWDEYYLLGHSMGAGIALEVTALQSQGIKGLMLIDGMGSPPLDLDTATTETRDALRKSIALKSTTRVFSDMKSLIAARLAGVHVLSQEAATRLCQRGSIAVDGGFTWSSDPMVRVHSVRRETEDYHREVISSIEQNICFVLADEVHAWKQEGVIARLDYGQNMQTITLAGSHHLHMEEQASTIAHHFRDFLQRQAA